MTKQELLKSEFIKMRYDKMCQDHPDLTPEAIWTLVTESTFNDFIALALDIKIRKETWQVNSEYTKEDQEDFEVSDIYIQKAKKSCQESIKNLASVLQRIQPDTLFSKKRGMNQALIRTRVIHCKKLLEEVEHELNYACGKTGQDWLNIYLNKEEEQREEYELIEDDE